MTSEIPSDPVLAEFALAAAGGSQVWAWRVGDRIHVGNAPHATLRHDTGDLLGQALRSAYGEAAGDAALRELAVVTRRGRGLPSRVVHRLMEGAQAAFSLMQGATFGLRVRFSAVGSGAGFRACCAALGIDERGLPFERRRDIDAQLSARLAGAASPAPEFVEECLKSILRRPLH